MKQRNLEHKNDWQTPIHYLEKLNNIFIFDFDPCPFCNDINSFDGLKEAWGKVNWINPPYSLKEKEAFIIKAYEESRKGNVCVMLLPVSTSTHIFHRIILPHADHIIFLHGRLKFSGWNKDGEWVDDKTGQHDSMIVVFGRKLSLEQIQIIKATKDIR